MAEKKLPLGAGGLPTTTGRIRWDLSSEETAAQQETMAQMRAESLAAMGEAKEDKPIVKPEPMPEPTKVLLTGPRTPPKPKPGVSKTELWDEATRLWSEETAVRFYGPRPDKKFVPVFPGEPGFPTAPHYVGQMEGLPPPIYPDKKFVPVSPGEPGFPTAPHYLGQMEGLTIEEAEEQYGKPVLPQQAPEVLSVGPGAFEKFVAYIEEPSSVEKLVEFAKAYTPDREFKPTPELTSAEKLEKFEAYVGESTSAEKLVEFAEAYAPTEAYVSVEVRMPATIPPSISTEEVEEIVLELMDLPKDQQDAILKRLPTEVRRLVAERIRGRKTRKVPRGIKFRKTPTSLSKVA